MTAEEVFLAAAERPAGPQRQEFLEQAFARSPELRAEVEELLRSHESAGSFLVEPLVEPLSAEMPDGDLLEAGAGEGDEVGPYRLLQLIGRGGMGLVYLAEQSEPVRRRVAIKIVKAEVATRNILARFEAERQALARMDHPNIARIFDAGTTPGGLPYFVMELVRGIPITTYCDEAQLTPGQRLELMVPVCQAVQHAHQKGIIHRDLKPSNVLVTEYDGRAVPKVIDFGVAKAVEAPTDPEFFTRFGSVVGTLEYMSPEQAGLNQLDIDTRSDVYSLGVLLYELLTGTTPLERRQLKKAALLEVLRIIREDDPPRPSNRLSSTDEAPSIAARRSMEPARLCGLVRGELDWIAMKALEKDRGRRYQSPAALSADLQRFMHNQPVEAGPPTARYRLRKFIRRNRATVAAGVLLVLSLVAGTIGTTAGMVSARRESAARQIALDEAQQERDQKAAALDQVRVERDEKTRALTAEQLARAAADSATDRAVEALQTLTDETVDWVLAAQPSLSEAGRDFINRIVAQLEQLTVATGASPAARVVQADGLNRVGNLKGKLGDLPGAVAAFRQAIAVWEPLCAEYADKPDYRRGMADAWSNLGNHLNEQQQFVEAEQAHLRAIELHEMLAAEFPANVSYRRNVANCRNSYGVMLKDVKRNAETMKQYEQAIALYQRILEEDPDDDETRIDLSNVQNNYGIELSLAGNREESIAAFRQLIDLRQQIAEREGTGPNDRFNYPMSVANLGIVLGDDKYSDEYLTMLEKAEPVARRVVDEFPAVAQYRERYAGLLDLLVNVYMKRNEFRKSIPVTERCSQLLTQLVRENPESSRHAAALANAANKLGMAWHRLDESDRALQHFNEARRLFTEVVARWPEDDGSRFLLANNGVMMASILADEGKLDEASAEFVSAIAEFEELLAKTPDHPRYRPTLATTLQLLATHLMGQRRFADAVPRWERAIELADADNLPDWRLFRARCEAPLNPASAIDLPQEIFREVEPTGAQLVYAARVLAVASTALDEGPARDQAVAGAMAFLQRASDTGWFANPEHRAILEKDADFDALRESPEFTRLIIER